MGFTLKNVIIISSILCMIACQGGPAGQFVLSDFESESDLDRVQWRCHTLFSLSDEHVTNGRKSLKLELYPSDYPGMAFELPMHNWSGYTMLALDIYNPQEEVIALAMRIDDRKEYPSFDDRYNNSFHLKPGMNHLNIPLATMATSGTKRNINLSTIHRFLIFMAQPQKKHILYIDHVHLA